MTVPILILGDAPNLPTGLARIARDLAAHLHQDSSLDVEVAQLGWGYDGSPFPWRVYPVYDSAEWAFADLEQTWNWHAHGREGILLTVWDPSRCYPTSKIKLPGLTRWGYFAIDAENDYERFGGPGAEALQAYDRILGYGSWGANILQHTVNYGFKHSGKPPTVSWLPHGIQLSVFKPDGGPIREHIIEAITRWQGTAATGPILGCVASNSPRKDLGSLFRSLPAGCKLWLHTDEAIRAWSIPELQTLYGPHGDRLLVSGVGEDRDGRHLKEADLTDHELALLYSLCDLTIAPGLGEGFGYPIVESLACGTPVVAVHYGGGVELIPDEAYLWRTQGMRIESIYALKRPVLENLRFDEFPAKRPPEYWRGAVAHLDWKMLWPRWRAWVQEGLEEL